MEAVKNIISAANWRSVNKIIASQIQSMQKSGEVLNILEAGCGQRWNLDIDKSGFRLAGIDLDAEALRLRTEVVKDLNEAIVGDLRTAKLGERNFDIIYNSYVLEHVSGAQKVLENFATWLKPKGLLVIKIPDSLSASGFVTRMTPHWFHIFYYRYIMRYPNAGKPGYAPYPVFYDPIVSRVGIRRFCAEHGLVLAAEYGISRYESDGQVFIRKLMSTITHTLSILSFGILSADHDGLLFFIRKA